MRTGPATSLLLLHLLCRGGRLGRRADRRRGSRGRCRGRGGRSRGRLGHQTRSGVAVHLTGDLQALGLLVVAQGGAGARAVHAIDRAGVVALRLQRLLGVPGVAPIHLAADLVLGLAGLGLGLVHGAIELLADRVLAVGLVLRALGLVLHLVGRALALVLELV